MASNMATFMTLLSYHIAKLLARESEKTDTASLHLLLAASDGKITTLWSSVRYFYWRKRESINKPLGLYLIMFVIVLGLRYAI